VSSQSQFFASAEDDQCVGFLKICEENCGGQLNAKSSMCKTWQGGVYKSCVCDGTGIFESESSEEMVRVAFSLFFAWCSRSRRTR